MESQDAILQKIETCVARRDKDAMQAARAELVELYPESGGASEAWYKLGLHALMVDHDMDRALECFVNSCRRKDSYWSLAARTSMGICMYHQGQVQKSLFELRKVGYVESPNIHSVTALAFIETIESAEGRSHEVKTVRNERIKQLMKLVQAKRRSADRELGEFLLSLGKALKCDGHFAEAQSFLEQAKGLGEELLGRALLKSVVVELR